MGIDVTISSAQCHPTVPESVSFYSAWKGKEFCYCLFMFSAPPNGELYVYLSILKVPLYKPFPDRYETLCRQIF